ncbi:P-loop containing nucleoside triphosphate hydrolase protein [Dipodascopsis tothii]|uniref:P-loop containing nucleoside triphosphate hydrolase protein n=1 Tax=Dipodascopsis tothii TaxID=44089 RepID=UPI0034CDA4AC
MAKRKRADEAKPAKRRPATAPDAPGQPGQPGLPGQPGEILDMNTLKWKKVKLPTRVGDLEGLMDFEEIDGVDVDYSGPSNTIVFKRAVPAQAAKEKTKKKVSGERLAEIKAAKSRAKAAKAERAATAAAAAATDPSSDHNKFAALEALDADTADVDLPEWTKLAPLSDVVLRALAADKFVRPTPIQALAIPVIAAGKDVIGKATTGSGKTLAFGIPLIERALASADDDGKAGASQPTALIVAPTRELAQQIAQHLVAASRLSSVSIVCVTGGLAVQKQIRLLARRPHIVVATPGRLHELLTLDTDDRGLVPWFRRTEVLVLDEADRLLQDGHFKELDEVLDMISVGATDGDDGDEAAAEAPAASRQTLVFSATFQKDLTAKLAARLKQKRKPAFVNNTLASKDDTMAYLVQKLNFAGAPEFLDANPTEAVNRRVIEAIIECPASVEKDQYLYYFLLRYPARTIVFVNSIDTANRLARLLNELRIPTLHLHSHMQQKQRLKTLERFKANAEAVLLATDVAARGLDIPAVQHVIHYHLPRTADMYVHRSGRTARGADADVGLSVILCSPDETGNLRTMIRVLGKSIKDIKSMHVERKVADKLKSRIALARDIIVGEQQLAAGAAPVGGRAQKQARANRAMDDLMRQAAADLGAELSDSDGELPLDSDRVKVTDARARAADKLRLQAQRDQLKHMLSKPVNTGLLAGSYLTSGLVNLAQRLVDGTGHKGFLGEDVGSALGDLGVPTRAF